ncbi:MAG: SMP-30/gluconolactonase/LRE family protein [Acidobacteria bacterium]|nr:SMP-30/gluconolactonase/LRE family protein [Acidobacteriota bacterium]
MRAQTPQSPAPTPALIRLDPALDKIIAADAKIEKIAEGYRFTEGPVWVRKGGYLLFSDIPANKIHQWTPDGKVSVYLDPSGYTGGDTTGVGREVNEGGEVFYNLGSNGITLDQQGRVTFNAMGDRAIVRIEPDGKRTVLADKFEGKRLNSTNDLVYRSDGALYFTDPPSALRGGDTDPKKELPYRGVFMLKDGKLHLLIRDIGPNGLAFSPDEKYFYVNDNVARTILRFDVKPDGTITNRKVLVDMSGEKAPGNPDGMKVDQQGNIYCTGAGGLWIISPDGKHLGTLTFPWQPSNMAFGGDDGKTLFVTARKALYRVRVKIAGVHP